MKKGRKQYQRHQLEHTPTQELFRNDPHNKYPVKKYTSNTFRYHATIPMSRYLEPQDMTLCHAVRTIKRGNQVASGLVSRTLSATRDARVVLPGILSSSPPDREVTAVKKVESSTVAPSWEIAHARGGEDQGGARVVPELARTTGGRLS